MLKAQFFIAAALLAGVAIGYFAKPDAAPTPEAPAKTAPAKSRPADMGESASLTALRARVAELERMLAKAQAQAAEPAKESEPVAQQPAEPERRRGGPPSFAEMRERFERMEKEDPERFAQMTNRFAQMRNRQFRRAQSKIEFLSSVDTSGMGEEALKTHEELQEMIARREELAEQLQRRDISDDERRAVFDELRSTGRSMDALGRAERDNLLLQTAASIGLSGEDAADFSSTIKAIIDATDGGMGRWGRPPPGPPPQ